MNSTLKTFLTIIITAAVVGGGVYFLQNQPKQQSPTTSNNTAQTETTQTTETQPPTPAQAPKVSRPPTGDAAEPDERGLHSKMTQTSQGTEYTNFIYRFSLILPKSWGEIVESKGDIPSGVKIHDSVRLASKNDSSQRYIQIQIVNTPDKNDPFVSDYPQTLLTGNSAYTFYYSGSQDYAGAGGLEESADSIKIQAEISSIQKSFKLF